MVWLDNKIWFPNPALSNSNADIIAAGGDLSPERLLLAYENGIFPWYNPGEEILWWCPAQRFVIFPGEEKISKSMKKILDRKIFEFTENQCFRKVMECCAETRKDGEGTWISRELTDSFTELHRRGYAKSFEVWQGEELVGGFYGVRIGRVFCGESMFSKVRNASKAGFLNFISNNHSSVDLIDCQVHSEHLESLGGKFISRNAFLSILKKSPNGSV